MKRLFLIFALAAATLSSVAAQAGAEGHGGMGIYDTTGKKLYLVDFYEAGIKDNPKFDNSIPTRPDYLDRVTKVLSSLFQPGSSEIAMVAQKLSEIANVSNAMSESLLIGMESYSWSPVDRPTVNPRDDHTPLVHKPEEVVPLALRRQRSIIFNPNFLKLSSSNRVGTIFHEIAYAFVPPSNGSQNSDRAKEFNGMIFSQTLSQRVNLLRSMAESLQLPFGQMNTFSSLTPKDNSVATIIFNPSFLWLKSDEQDCESKVETDCTPEGKRIFRYFPGEKQDPIKDFCGSYGGYYTNRFITVAYSILDVKFQTYSDVSGNAMDYLEAQIVPDTYKLPYPGFTDSYRFDILFAGKDCITTFTNTLTSQDVKDFFSKFKPY